MKARTIYHYASSRTMHRFLLYCLTILLCTAMFILLLASWFAWRYVRHERYALNKCLDGGIKQCGMLLLESTENDFWADVSQMEELVGFTSSGVYSATVDDIEKFGVQQTKLDPEYVENTGYVPLLCMDDSGINVCHFNLQEGKYPEEWQLEKDEVLMYLGGNFENVTVGERIQSKSEPFTYVVGGVLEKGTNWICDDVYIFENVTDSHYVECLDNMVIELDPNPICSRVTYCVKKGYQMEDVETKLMELAQKNGAVIKLARLEDVLDENEYQFSIVLNVIRLLTVMILVTSLIVLERTQYSEMVNDTEYFGIFYANGASTRDLVAILLGENLLKTAVSFGLAVVIGYYYLRSEWQIYQPGIDQWNTAKSVYFGQAVLPSLLIGTGIIVLCTRKSIHWLKKRKPVELLKDYKV